MCDEIASGGMATVHIGRLIGLVDFSRTVAIKRLLPHVAKDPMFVSMFLDEARLAAAIRHPNVMPTLDIVSSGDDLFVVMDYVAGESLSRLIAAGKEAGKTVPFPIALSIITQVLHGLHAAHEAHDRRGNALEIVHRDVSPQNILVGVDGVARILDFGIAKAASRGQNTADGQIKGKIAYMSSEQLQAGLVDRRTDIFAASIVLWELLAGERLFATSDSGATIAKILAGKVETPSGAMLATKFPKELDAIVLRGLARNPNHRFQTAEEMATALENVMAVPRAREIGAWVEKTASVALRERADIVEGVERISMKMPAAAESSPAMASLIEGAENERRRSEEPTDVGGRTQEKEVTHVPVVATPIVVVAPPTKRKPSINLALGLIAALLAVAIIAVWFSTSRSKSSASAAAPSISAAPSAPAAELEAPAKTTASDVDAAPAKPVVSKPSKQAAHPPGKKKPDCDPEYTVDAQGMKHFKPECL